MQTTINIKDSSKAKAFLNFIKSMDFVTARSAGFAILRNSFTKITNKI